MARPKFIADADANEKVILGLLRHEPTVDILTAAEAGTRDLTDRQILELAASRNRIVISSDRNTMTAEFFQLLKEGRSSPGLIIITQNMDVGEAIEQLLLIWAATSHEEHLGQAMWVPL